MGKIKGFFGRKNIRNVIIVLIGNIFTIISSILIGFFVPKMMGQVDFGYYKTFHLYFDYTPFLSIGFSDGIYLIFAGTAYEHLDKPKFRMFFKMLFASMAILSLLVCGISAFFLNTDYGFILFFDGLTILLSNLLNYFQYLSRVTERYTELTFRDILKACLNMVSVITLFVLYKMGIMSALYYKLYVVIFVSILAVIVIMYAIKYREILFVGETAKMKDNKALIKDIFCLGVPLMIANFVNSFILLIDRQFVNVTFDKTTFAIYAFAYSMLGFITVAISAISTVLFPVLKRIDPNNLKDKYVNLLSAVAIVVAVCLTGYFPIYWICENFLNNYMESMQYFRIILPGLMISSSITMVMYNYYKAMNAITEYFVKSIIVLVIAFISDLVAYLIFKTPVAISIASIITYVIWYFVVEFKFYRTWKLNYFRNIVYLLLISAAFYLITMINNVYIAFGVWVAAFVVITIPVQFKIIKSKFKI